MKYYKTHSICIVLVLVLLVIIGFVQFDWFKSPEYLASVTAEGGAIIGQVNAEGCFELTLKDVEHVVWFTDRPARDARSTNVSVLIDVWAEQFAEVPPNADLQLFDEDRSDATIIVELESAPVWDENKGTLTFNNSCLLPSVADLEIISSGTFSKGVLFIDGAVGDFFEDLWEDTSDENLKQTFTEDYVDPIKEKVIEPTKNLFKKLMTDVDYGHWEEHAMEYAGVGIDGAVKAGGEIGLELGGKEGERYGANVGAVIGGEVVGAVGGVISGGSISDATMLDIADIYAAMEAAATEDAEDYAIAYNIVNNMLEEQGKDIEDMLVHFIFDIESAAGLSTAYNKDNFCGATNDAFTRKVLSKIVLFYLRLELEARIFYDLKSGMTYEGMETNVGAHIGEDVELAIEYALWDLQGACISKVPDDFYTLVYEGFFVYPFDSNNNSIIDFNEYNKIAPYLKVPQGDGFNPYNNLWYDGRPSSDDILDLILPVGSFNGYIPNDHPMLWAIDRGGG
jgi:uncharacterized protein YcfJ